MALRYGISVSATRLAMPAVPESLDGLRELVRIDQGCICEVRRVDTVEKLLGKARCHSRALLECGLDRAPKRSQPTAARGVVVPGTLAPPVEQTLMPKRPKVRAKP
jgi:hypothetical protein